MLTPTETTGSKMAAIAIGISWARNAVSNPCLNLVLVSNEWTIRSGKNVEFHNDTTLNTSYPRQGTSHAEPLFEVGCTED